MCLVFSLKTSGVLNHQSLSVLSTITLGRREKELLPIQMTVLVILRRNRNRGRWQERNMVENLDLLILPVMRSNIKDKGSTANQNKQRISSENA